MNDFSPHPRAGGPLPATTSDEDTVAVRTRVWCTAVMITVSAFMCLVQTSFAATRYINNPVNAMYVWFIASSLLAFAFPFLLLARDKHPEPVFWICCAVMGVPCLAAWAVRRSITPGVLRMPPGRGWRSCARAGLAFSKRRSDAGSSSFWLMRRGICSRARVVTTAASPANPRGIITGASTMPASTLAPVLKKFLALSARPREVSRGWPSPTWICRPASAPAPCRAGPTPWGACCWPWGTWTLPCGWRLMPPSPVGGRPWPGRMALMVCAPSRG